MEAVQIATIDSRSGSKHPSLDERIRIAIAEETGCQSSPVRICFTGRVRKGSWKIRGLQIAAARRNWNAVYELGHGDVSKYDLFCVVKKPDEKILSFLRKMGAPIVYDVVDNWAQPEDGLRVRGVASARELFREKFAQIKAYSYIFPNRTMKEHCRSLVPHATYIYHHYWPGIRVNPIREQVHTVGYEGNPRYLGPWEEIARELCTKMGWKFVINPEDSSVIDIGLAARGGDDDNFLSNTYKSNVKLANFYGAGTPCVVSAKEVSYHETDNGDVRFFANRDQLARQLESLRGYEVRKAIQDRFLREREKYSIANISAAYEAYFLDVLRRLGDQPVSLEG